jgi:hypothetical protein
MTRTRKDASRWIWKEPTDSGLNTCPNAVTPRQPASQIPTQSKTAEDRSALPRRTFSQLTPTGTGRKIQSAARGKQSPLAALGRVKGSEVHYESEYCVSALLWEGSVGTTRMKKTSAEKHKGETRSPNWRYSLSSSDTKGRPQTPTNRKQDVRDPEQCPFATSFSQQG